MSKKKDKQKRAASAAAPPSPPAKEPGATADAHVFTPAERPRPAPRWVLAAGFGAYALFMGLMVWLALQPKPVEPLPARLIQSAPVIVTGRAGPNGLAVTEVLKGQSGAPGSVLPLAAPPPQADPADRIHFLQFEKPGPDGPLYGPHDAKIPSAPTDPILLNQVREVLRVDALRKR